MAGGIRARSGGGGGGGKQYSYRDIMDQYRKQQEAANKANEERYQNILSALADSREQVAGTYGQASDLLEDLGMGQQERIERQRTRELGRSEQDLVRRGLGNTTVRETTRRGIEDDSLRQQRELTEQVGAQQAGLLLSQAGAQERQGNFLADMMERRTDRGPDLGMMAQLMQQYAAGLGAGAGDDGRTNIFTGLSANARAGRDAFGQPMGTPGSSGGRPNMVPGSPGTPASSFSKGRGSGGGGGANQAQYRGPKGGGSQYRQAGDRGAQAYGQTYPPGSRGGGPSGGGSFYDLFQGQPVYHGGEQTGTYGESEFKPTSFQDLFSPQFEGGDITDLFGDLPAEEPSPSNNCGGDPTLDPRCGCRRGEKMISGFCSGGGGL